MLRIKIHDGSVTFTVTGEDAGQYHTNHQGEGLWQGAKQILGLCQFNCRQVSRATMRRRFLKVIQCN